MERKKRYDLPEGSLRISAVVDEEAWIDLKVEAVRQKKSVSNILREILNERYLRKTEAKIA